MKIAKYVKYRQQLFLLNLFVPLISCLVFYVVIYVEDGISGLQLVLFIIPSIPGLLVASWLNVWYGKRKKLNHFLGQSHYIRERPKEKPQGWSVR
jgi:uncharacterized membrane protein